MPALLEGRPLPGRVPALPRLAASSLSDTRAISAAAAVLALAVWTYQIQGGNSGYQILSHSWNLVLLLAVGNYFVHSLCVALKSC